MVHDLAAKMFAHFRAASVDLDTAAKLAADRLPDTDPGRMRIIEAVADLLTDLFV
ncbi:MAG: hypothetical protein U1E56_02330 [Bauldia sp.]